jgi:hypothetical protein
MGAFFMLSALVFYGSIVASHSSSFEALIGLFLPGMRS